MDYSSYDSFYDERPEVIVHSRLAQSGIARKMLEKASRQGFLVEFSHDRFRDDVIVRENGRNDTHPRSMSLAQAQRYFSRM
jgi:hypothetical protein